ncbi:MAG: hypothetical protein ABR616_15435 [Dermatophilaceae bacterium]
MSDYEGWAEAEIDHDEWRALDPKPEGPHKRRDETFTWTGAKRYQPDPTTHRYFRLDPPAPTYREGEMRWVTHHGNRFLAVFSPKGDWADVNHWDIAWDEESEYVTLSEPVVVVPAPSEEERASLLGEWAEDQMWSTPGNRYLQRIANQLREQQR